MQVIFSHLYNNYQITLGANMLIHKNLRLKKVTMCDDHFEIPDEQDTVFVGKYEIVAVPTQTFRVFLTTKRLIKLADKTEHFLSNATYKLTYENFPILKYGNLVHEAKKCSFDAVGMDVPIQANRKKGRRKYNVNSLQKKTNETQSVATAPKGKDSDEDDVLTEVSKRPRLELQESQVQEINEKM
ncbi:unnamed protein product [Brachionus calyciflorus]|uniref:Uncharacterized protein n=1 Tax=Brachionus calyciflorus TaxID=104777 RepID=A0A814DWF9_9BILA|nr:unnamed protein product [Brachionus calyciflorus]